MGLAPLLVAFTISCGVDHPNTAVRQIRGEAIEAHMRFLADDLLEGRLPGTRGYDLAARYVAAQFQAAGLAPAGVAHTYFQPVPLERMEVPSGDVTILKDGHQEQLAPDQDFLLTAIPSDAHAEVRATAVFAGYCVHAPELGHDDYAQLDARGRILVCLDGAPSRFPSAELAHYSGISKLEQAAARGAVGVVDLWVGDFARDYPFPIVVDGSKFPDFRWLDGSGWPHDAFPELRGYVTVGADCARKLFRFAPKTLEQSMVDAGNGTAQAFPLGVDFEIRTNSRNTMLTSSNVIAMLPGTDRKLRDEYVVFSAHIDHLGVGPAVHGDSIYNGAVDNASGVAGLIEIARAFTRLPHPPRRSLLFLGVTAEDAGSVGLLGSDYFAHHPTIPPSSIVADINIDGLPFLFDFRDVVAYGAEHSSLATTVKRAARSMGLEVSPDPWPDQDFFIRSDQYSFVRQGVPSVWIKSGLKARDPHIDGKKVILDWFARYYHTPQDDMKQRLNLEALTRGARLQFLVGDLLADADSKPTWNKGDSFGETFAHKKRGM